MDLHAIMNIAIQQTKACRNRESTSRERDALFAVVYLGRGRRGFRFLAVLLLLVPLRDNAPRSVLTFAIHLVNEGEGKEREQGFRKTHELSLFRRAHFRLLRISRRRLRSLFLSHRQREHGESRHGGSVVHESQGRRVSKLTIFSSLVFDFSSA